MIGAIRDCVLRADSGVRLPVLYIGTIRIRLPTACRAVPVGKDSRVGRSPGRSDADGSAVLRAL